MAFLDADNVDILKELPREIPNKEILGRRLYLMINNIVPKASVLEDVLDWSTYSIVFPKDTDISFHTLSKLNTIDLSFNPIQKTLSIKALDNINALEVRTIAQHILTELKIDDE
jgi:hypothetical protein